VFYQSVKFPYNKHGDATADISEAEWLLVVYESNGTKAINIMRIGKGYFLCGLSIL